MRRMGQVPASVENAGRALDEGLPVLVYPGGDHELFRPWLDRNRIDFGGRKGLKRLRMNNLPILWQLPWGISPPGPFYVPMPAKITVQVCEPLDWSAHGPDAAQDPEIVDRCYAAITQVMQATLTALGRENPWPLARRLRSLLP